jgi:hypothetical protein
MDALLFFRYYTIDYLGDLTFISFNYENLLKVRKILPTQSAQFLFSAFTEEIIENLSSTKSNADFVDFMLKKLH